MFFDPSPTLTELGIPEPPEVAEAREMAGIVTTLANTPPVPVIPHATTAQTVEGEMRRYLAARELRSYAQEVHRDFERHANSLTRDIYFEAAPGLVREIPKRAAKPLKAITDAAKHIGPDDTAETVLARGKAAADAWRNRDQLDDARALLTQAARVQRMLGEMLRTIPNHTAERELLWWVDVEDHNHLARLDGEAKAAGCPGGRFLALAHAGHELSLATPAEFMARVRHVEEAAEAEATREQRAARAREEARNRDIGGRLVAAHERVMVRE